MSTNDIYERCERLIQFLKDAGVYHTTMEFSNDFEKATGRSPSDSILEIPVGKLATPSGYVELYIKVRYK